MGIEPRYEFGYGLTYTKFEYSNIEVTRNAPASNFSILPPTQSAVPGGNPSLWENLFRVSATVTNSGHFASKEVAQLYISVPGDDTPIRQLRGFNKRLVPAGQSRKLDFHLTRKDLSTWNIVEQDWVLRRGTYEVHVGLSNRNLPLNATFTL
jgi:beta-glucosidase